MNKTLHIRIFRIWSCLGLCWALNACVALVPLLDKKEPSPQEASLCPIGYTSDIPRTVVSYHPQKKKNSRLYRAINHHVQNLRHKETVVRIRAASSLGELGPKAGIAVNPLIRSLNDQHYWVRREAAKSLGKIRAKQAVQPLILALGDKDRWVAHSAANALKKIGTAEARQAVAVYTR